MSRTEPIEMTVVNGLQPELSGYSKISLTFSLTVNRLIASRALSVLRVQTACRRVAQWRALPDVEGSAVQSRPCLPNETLVQRGERLFICIPNWVAVTTLESKKMPKMKSSRGAKKRFKVTKSGKIKYNRANRRHILTKKSSKRKDSFGRLPCPGDADRKAVTANG